MRGGREAARTIELRIPALPESVALARLALGAIAAVVDLPPESAEDLKLAVSETCTNAVVHAYPDESERSQVTVRYTVAGESLTVEVLDSGVGFDPSTATSTLSRNGSPSQMGLAIARAVTDEFEIESGPAGTRVVFRNGRRS